MAGKKIALFIDADNISPKFGKKILETLESRGELFIRRIYGNWEKSSLHGWNETILNCSLRAVQQPDFVTGKNATDMSLTIDAMDVLHDGKAEIFALVSNDSDFTPLVIRLREGNVAIIGLGNAHASAAFRSACTEFIELDSLDQPTKTVATAPPVTTVPQISAPVPKIKLIPIEKVKPVKKIASDKKDSSVQMSLFDGENSAKPEPQSVSQSVVPEPEPQSASQSVVPETSSSKVVPITNSETFTAQDRLQAVHDVLKETTQLHGDKNGFTELCWAGQTLHEKRFHFSIKNFGYSSLQKFIADFPDRYELTTRDNKTVLYYRCHIDNPNANLPLDDKLEKMHATLREAITECPVNENGFILLNWAGTFVKNENLGFRVRDFGYKNLQKFIAAFPDRYEMITQKRNKIYYRCRTDEPTSSVDDLTISVDEPTTLTDGQLSFIGKIKKLHAVLHSAAAALRAPKKFTPINYAGEVLREKNLGFGVKDFGYKTLRQFMANFPEMYEIIRNDKENLFYYRCHNKKPLKVPDDIIDQIHDFLREFAKDHHNDSGFTFINYVGKMINKDEQLRFGIKYCGYKTLREFIAAFPEIYELTRPDNSKVFYYRCRGDEQKFFDQQDQATA